MKPPSSFSRLPLPLMCSSWCNCSCQGGRCISFARGSASCDFLPEWYGKRHVPSKCSKCLIPGSESHFPNDLHGHPLLKVSPILGTGKHLPEAGWPFWHDGCAFRSRAQGMHVSSRPNTINTHRLSAQVSLCQGVLTCRPHKKNSCWNRCTCKPAQGSGTFTVLADSCAPLCWPRRRDHMDPKASNTNVDRIQQSASPFFFQKLIK